MQTSISLSPLISVDLYPALCCCLARQWLQLSNDRIPVNQAISAVVWQLHAHVVPLHATRVCLSVSLLVPLACLVSMSSVVVWTQICAVMELVLAQSVRKLHKDKTLGAQLCQLMLCAMLEVSPS
jgi:hypothetical protein